MAMEKKMVVLKSSDGEKFEVEEAVAMKSELIKKIIEEGCTEDPIPLDNVTGNILTMVIQFCKRHVDSTTPDDDELKVFDTKFVQVDHPTLSNIILAANYLNIKSLLDLTCKTVLDMIKGETPEVIVKTFENYSPGGGQEIVLG